MAPVNMTLTAPGYMSSPLLHSKCTSEGTCEELAPALPGRRGCEDRPPTTTTRVEGPVGVQLTEMMGPLGAPKGRGGTLSESDPLPTQGVSTPVVCPRTGREGRTPPLFSQSSCSTSTPSKCLSVVACRSVSCGCPNELPPA